MSELPERPKRHLPTGARAGALALGALAAGVILPNIVAWIILALAAVVLGLDLAGTRRAQEWLPGLGRLPFVRDHELKRQPAVPRGERRALPTAPVEPSEDERLADRAEHQAAQLRALCAEWDARDEFAIEGERVERVRAAARAGLATYHGEHSVETMRIFDALVAHGVAEPEARGLVEGPRFADDVLNTARILVTGAKRLRLHDDALAAWLDVHAAVIDDLEATMRSYAEQEETDTEQVTATNEDFRLTYGGVLSRVNRDAEVWMQHIGSFPPWSDPLLSEGTTPDQAERAARLYAWINRRIKNIAQHVRSAEGDAAHVEFGAAEIAAFKDFAHDFAGWLKSHEIEAPPDMTSVFGEDYEHEQLCALTDGEITPQEYQRNVRPFTERQEWANKVRAEYHRDWWSKAARNVEWARQSGAMQPIDVRALFVCRNPHGGDLNELAETIERIADRL